MDKRSLKILLNLLIVREHGEHPRRIEDFEGRWLEFEGMLAGLVGNYLNLLDRLDRIRTAEPTKERRGALRNLLESEARRAYFFS